MSESDKNSRHIARMQRKKAVVDAHIEAAQVSRGLLLIHTGNGKGKSSSAFGVLARALGHGFKAAVVQFIKGRSDTVSEIQPIKHAFSAGIQATPGIEY